MSIVKIHIAIAIILQKSVFFKPIRVLYYTIIPSRDEVVFCVTFYQLLSSSLLNALFAPKRTNQIYFSIVAVISKFIQKIYIRQNRDLFELYFSYFAFVFRKPRSTLDV